METSLPANFLAKPESGKVTKEVIDWEKTTLPQNQGRYAAVLDGLFTEYECKKMVEAAQAANMAATGHTWEQALVSVSKDEQVLLSDYRNSDRIIVDDADMAARIWRRVAPHVPEIDRDPVANAAELTGNGPVLRGEVYRFAGLNERLRFLQYTAGGFFRPHCDAAYVRDDESERSFYTLHLYLNEADDANPLVGGATSFHDRKCNRENDIDVVPKIGRVLIFQHRGLLHSGQDVGGGLKLTMRTDIMFKRTDEVVAEKDRSFSRENKPKQPYFGYLTSRKRDTGEGN